MSGGWATTDVYSVFTAAVSGNIEQLNKAIAAGGNVDQFLHEGSNALDLASIKCNSTRGVAGREMVCASLRAGIRLNALHLASMECNKEMVRVLLNAGAKVNLKNKVENRRIEKVGGQTPLHNAVLFCEAGNEDLVQLLLDAGADPHLTNDIGFTPGQLMQWHTNHNNITQNYQKYAALLKAISNIVKVLKPYYNKTKTAAPHAHQAHQKVSPSSLSPVSCL